MTGSWNFPYVARVEDLTSTILRHSLVQQRGGKAIQTFWLKVTVAV
jgi:hypothetical protein